MSKPLYGMALAGSGAVLALLALTPAGASFLPGEAATPAFYGMAELTHRNADGDLLASQSVHNQLVDSGEIILVNGTFGSLAASEKPTLLCISDVEHTGGTIGTADVETALPALFVPGTSFALTSTNTCVTADINTTVASVAIMNATFEGTTNVQPGQTINSVVVCNTDTSTTNRQNCVNAGDIFSSINILPTTVGASDTVDVVYVFNVTSDTS